MPSTNLLDLNTKACRVWFKRLPTYKYEGPLEHSVIAYGWAMMEWFIFPEAWITLEKELELENRRYWWLDRWQWLIPTCAEPTGRWWKIKRWWHRKRSK